MRTPALARAKIGTTTKLVSGWSRCWRRSATDTVSLAMIVIWCISAADGLVRHVGGPLLGDLARRPRPGGAISPNATPARVGVHARLVGGEPAHDRQRDVDRRPPHARRLQHDGGHDGGDRESQRRRDRRRRCTRPRSRRSPRCRRRSRGMSRNSLSADGAREPSRARTPTAKAMSVAMGIAPAVAAVAPGVDREVERRRAPPCRRPRRAPAAPPPAGRAARRSTSSRLISSPTTKKNSVIRPSLTKWRRSIVDSRTTRSRSVTSLCQNAS